MYTYYDLLMYMMNISALFIIVIIETEPCVAGSTSNSLQREQLEMILDLIYPITGNPTPFTTLVTPDHGVNMYVNEIYPLTAYQIMLSGMGDTSNIWSNYSPCPTTTNQKMKNPLFMLLQSILRAIVWLMLWSHWNAWGNLYIKDLVLSLGISMNSKLLRVYQCLLMCAIQISVHTMKVVISLHHTWSWRQ